MTVKLIDSTTIALAGNCTVEDADHLLQHLLANPGAEIDWRECDRMHASVLQVLLAAKPRIKGVPRGQFLQDWIAPLLPTGQ